MQCVAVAASSGRQCQRLAMSGDRYCYLHRNARKRGDRVVTTSSNDLHAPRVATPVTGDLPAGLGIEDEIAMLRRQIREADQVGDQEGVRRGVETLCKALKVQHVIMGRSEESLAASLSKVLEEVGAELGTVIRDE